MAVIPARHITLRDGASITIRTAEPGDASGLIDLDHDIVLHAPYNVTQPDEFDRDQNAQLIKIKEHAEQPGYMYLVAVHVGRIVGEVNFRCMKPRVMRHHGHFGIGIAADFRSRGLGFEMLRVLIDWARAHEFIERIDLGVFADNAPARALYRKLGFSEVCRREREFRMDDGRCYDDIQMSLRVKP